ncbi:MAG: M48 family metallopeptidase [Acidobacteria bacterium]|nr:M48 family metallopeptidase [Acidobacteriota bacterium]
MATSSRSRHRHLRSAAVLIALALWSAPTSGALRLVSVNDEIALGRQANAQVKQQTPEVGDATVLRYVRGLGRTLAAHADGPRYPYSFDVANYGEVNAFALPGGPVWVHRGALSAAQNEAQLASVLAHEIAHIAKRHAADQITNGTIANVGLGVLGALLGDGRKSQIAQIGASLAAQSTMAKFSRDDEREADAAGLQYMRRAGFDTRGAAEFMQELRAQQRRNPSSVAVFFSSHPAPAERISRLDQQAARLGQGGRRDSAAFRGMKRRLQDLGAPATMRR